MDPYFLVLVKGGVKLRLDIKPNPRTKRTLFGKCKVQKSKAENYYFNSYTIQALGSLTALINRDIKFILMLFYTCTFGWLLQ